jgi:hypothetical protein
VGEARISQWCHLGRVTAGNGKVLDNWVTWRGKHKAVVRRDSHVTHRLCDVCKRDIYFATGKPYLYPAPPSGTEIIQAGARLILTESMAEELGVREWKVVSIEPLPVLSAPRDGLPALYNPAC